MRPSTAAVFDSIRKSFSPSEKPRLLHDVVAHHIVALKGASDLDDALEQAEVLLPEIKALVIQHHNQNITAGTVWVFELFGSGDEYIRGSSSENKNHTAAEQSARSRRLHFTNILDELRALSFQEFEVACTSILQIMGCASPHTSPSSDDGGIDFYGQLELKGRLDNSSLLGGFDSRVHVWLVGQAKHYKSRAVGTAHLRELVGSVELARTGGAIHDWEGLSMRPFDAVMQLIFTTGTFSSGANRLLSRSGLIAMDGRQLATFLADAGVGIDSTDGTFTKRLFRTALGLLPMT